jgi:hypothetical protein
MTVEPIFPPVLPPLGNWARDAACANEGHHTFFPEKQQSHLMDKAKRLCCSCTVREECLAYALANKIDFGYWGGMSGRQRRAMRKDERANRPPRPILEGVEHGTSYAYKKGCGCLPCKLAERRMKRERREREQAAAEGVA